MNKLYSLLIAAVICSAASGLVASEAPFFDQKTQGKLIKTAKFYALGYGLAYGTGTGFAAFGTVAAAPFMALWALGTNDEKALTAVINPLSTVKAVSREIYKPITRSMLVTAPVVFGGSLLWHKYQESLRERNAA